MSLLRANADDLMHVGFDEILFLRWKELGPVYPQIFNIKSSKRKYQKSSGFSGFGTLTEKGEGENMDSDSPIQGYDTTFTHRTYALYARVTMELQEDDQYDIIRRLPSALADATYRTIESYAAEVFNNAFTAAGRYLTGGDGKYLCATDHPLTGGGTQANKPATDADLSLTSIEAGLTAMRKIKGDRGEHLSLVPKVLLIPPDSERLAFELLKSSGRPDTSNRVDNWLATKGLQVISWDFLSDTDCWFLLTDKSQHELTFYNRKDNETDSERDFKTKDFMYSVLNRFSAGWLDYKGVYGSAGG